MSIKLDLHVHSDSHGKILIGAEELSGSLRRNHLDGVAITNFSSISHALWLKEKIKEYIIIVGQEIWTNDGHIVGLGIREKIDDFQSAQETIGQIREQGGIAVVVHPFFLGGIGKKAMLLSIDAIEGYNAAIGMYFIHNYFAKKLAERMNIAQLASSDTTDPNLIGRSYTEVMTKDSRLILEAIRSANVRAFKRALPMPLTFILKSFLKFRNLEPCSIHAVPCLICGKSMTIRLFKESFKCLDCGKIEFSRVVCCNGHYFCLGCLFRRVAVRSRELKAIGYE